MAFEVGAVVARLELVTKDFSRGIKKAEAQTADLRMALDQVSGAFGKVAAVSGAAFVAITGALGFASRTGAKFEEAMVNVGAVTGATGETLAELSDIAVKTGEATIFSAGQVSQAMFALGSQGVKTADQFKNLLRPALDLAAAAQVDVAFATETVLANLRAFRLDFAEAGRVANIFSSANENSALTVQKLGVALTPVAPIAGALGIGIEEVTAALGILVGAGFDAAESGTALRNIFLRLQKPAGAAKKILDKVGLSTKKLGELSKDPIKLIKALTKANLSNADALEIFGTRAVAAFLTLREGVGDMENLTKAITGTDSASRIAEQQLAATTAQFKLMLSAIEGAAIALFQTLQPAINVLINGTRNIVLSISAWIKENRKLTAAIAIGASAITGFVAVVTGMIAVLAAAAGSFVALKVSMAGLKVVAPGVVSAMNKIKIAGVGLGKSLGLVGLAGIIGFTLGKVIDNIIRNNFPKFSAAIDRLIGKIVGLNDELAKVTGTAVDFASRVARAGEILINKNLPAINTVRERSRLLRATLKNLGIEFKNLGPPTRAAFVAFKDGKIDAEQLRTELGKLGEATVRLKELQARPVEGLSLEDQQAEFDLQQQFIDQQLGFSDQIAEKENVRLSKKDLEIQNQESLVEKIGQQINLEGKLGTVIDGVLSGTQGLGDSFGEFIKSIGKAIAKALVLQAIMLALKGIFGGGPIGKLLGFNAGGVVPGAQMGLLPPREDVLVGVQRGEGILNRPTVQRLGGAAGIENLNQGGGVGGNTTSNTFNFPSALGVTPEAVEQFRQIKDQMDLEFAPAT